MPRTLNVAGGRAGQSLRTYSCFDFRGGLDVVTSPTVLAFSNTPGRTNRLSEAKNVVYFVDGTVSKRWGSELITTPTGPSSYTAHLGGILFQRSDGTEDTVIAIQGGIVGKVVGTGFSAIASMSPSVGLRYSFAVYNDTLFIANGVDPLYAWDVISSGGPVAAGSPTKARQVVAHGNRLFATDRQYPSRLFWSRLNNPLDWTGTDDAGYLDVNPNDGGTIKALVPSIQELALLKTYRPYRLQGIGPLTGYTVADALVPAAGSIGCVNHTAAAFVANDVYYMSQMGVHTLSATDQFGDLKQAVISDRVEPFFRQDHDYRPYGMDYSPYLGTSYQTYEEQYNSFMACHDWGNNLIFFGQNGGMPRGSTGPTTNAMDRFLIYDLRLKNWAMWETNGPYVGVTDYPGEFTCMWPSQHRVYDGSTYLGSVPEMRLGAYFRPDDTCAIVAMRRGLKNDLWGNAGAPGSPSTVPIVAAVSHVSALGTPGLRKCPRYLYLYFRPESVSTTITVEITYDFEASPQVTTSFDIHSLTPETRIVKRVDLGQHLCEFMMIRVSNGEVDKSFRWHGYEVQWSARRSIRRSA